MARNLYGGTAADFTLTNGGRVVPNVTITLWTAITGGTQITDLTDLDGNATTTVTSGPDGSVRYFGPNNDKSVHWADDGNGTRIGIRPIDITGATGAAPNLTVGTVTTGAPGSTASATITGTNPDYVLGLTVPRGDTGATGPAGPANTLAIGTVTTGAVGSGAAASITGAAPNQTLNLTLPTGATGATGAAIGGILTTKGDIVAYSTTATRQPVGTDGQILFADSAQATGLNYAYPTNLLRNNIATAGDSLGTTTGFPTTTADGKHSQITYSLVDKVADPTYAGCITQGSKALKMVKASGGGTGAIAGVPLFAAGIGSNAINGGTYPVIVGDTITFAFDVSSITHTDLFRASIRFYASSGSGGTLVSEVLSGSIALSATPVRHQISAKVPAGATHAAFWARTNSAIGTASSCEAIFDRFQLNYGIGARWSVSPMQLADDGTVWTTGSPEGIITAPIGAICCDEAGTAGAVTWIKQTGSGSTGWCVVQGDTGIRDLSAEAMSNSWTVNTSTFQLRRVGNVVTVNALVDKTSATSDTVYTLPAGFRPAMQHRDVLNTTTSDDFAPVAISTAGVITITRSAMTGAVAQLTTQFTASTAWPTTLPGV